MRSIGIFNIIALIAGIMVLAIAFILIPVIAWNTAAITSVVLFALSVGFIFYVPSIIANGNQGGNDAAQIASLGPAGVIAGVMLPLTACAAVFALLSLTTIAWVMDILAVGGFAISLLLLRAMANIISSPAQLNSTPSKHTAWGSEIQVLCSMASDATTRKSLEKLAEKFRFAPSDVVGGSPQDSQLDGAVKSLTEQLAANSAASVQEQISKMEVLIAQRSAFLVSARSKA